MQRTSTERSLALRLHLRRHLGRLHSRRARDRRLRPTDRRLAGVALDGVQFVLDALEQALHDRRPVQDVGLVHHSNRGSQYVSIRYTERFAEAGLQPSVGSVGDSYDNALAETVIGLYKTEVIHRRGPWRTLHAVELATLALDLLLKAAASLSGLLRCCSQEVDWFNKRRLLEQISVSRNRFSMPEYRSL